MKPGYVFQTGQFESEILASGDFQLVSITLDSLARYAPAVYTDGSNTKIIPKGTLVTLDTALSDGTYLPINTRASFNDLNGTPTQFMKDAVVLAESVDVTNGDVVVKAYWAGTFKWTKIKYNYMGTTTITLAQCAACQRLKFIDGPSA